MTHPTVKPQTQTQGDAGQAQLPAADISAGVSRRGLLKTAVAASAATLAISALGPGVYAAGSDQLKLALIGCGGRGSGALGDNLQHNEGVQVVAIADAFQDRLDGAFNNFQKYGKEKFAVTKDRCFVGLDAYKKVMELPEVNLVLMATPPAFRSIHILAAVEAGKNVFAEKPVAVDATGIRRVLKAADLFTQKNLAFMTGTQRRHEARYLETIGRIHDGAIGDVVAGYCYWNQGSLWNRARDPKMTDVEWQLRNWLYFTWLSGDHIVEQHVHNLDVMNWVMGGPPVEAYGMGGRQVRTDPAFGMIFDHFAIEYRYKNGARVTSFCRQQDGTDNEISEFVIGTKGTSNPGGSISGENKWNFPGHKGLGPYQQEHVDLVNSIREGKPLNEAKRIAESTMTAILGRTSCYTGKRVKWEDALHSHMDLVPENLTMETPMPVAPVPTPGKTTDGILSLEKNPRTT